jgi:hypothetical protein
MAWFGGIKTFAENRVGAVFGCYGLPFACRAMGWDKGTVAIESVYVRNLFMVGRSRLLRARREKRNQGLLLLERRGKVALRNPMKRKIFKASHESSEPRPTLTHPKSKTQDSISSLHLYENAGSRCAEWLGNSSFDILLHIATQDRGLRVLPRDENCKISRHACFLRNVISPSSQVPEQAWWEIYPFRSTHLPSTFLKTI